MKMSEKALSRKRVADAIAEQEWPKKPRILNKTDKTRWRLNDDDGRHKWVYLEDDAAAKKWPQSYSDKYFLGLPLVSPSPGHIHLHGDNADCLSSCRVYPIFQSPRRPSTPRSTALRSTKSSSWSPAIGAANMVVPCF